MDRRTVILESPFAGDVERNFAYAKRAMLHSLLNDEAPFASHLLYTQVLDDSQPSERSRGIEAGLAIGARLDATVVYADHGISPGMRLGIVAALKAGRPVEVRYIES